MTAPSPRQRFVEAMRDTMDVINGAKRQAIEAFADAECREGLNTENDGQCYGTGDKQHAACRASLLRECGLEP